MSVFDRRQLIQSFAAIAAFSAIAGTKALASNPTSLDKWAQNLADLNRDLSAGRITLIEWQDKILALNTGVELEELKRYLDFDKLTNAMKFPSKLAETADPHLPDRIVVDGIERPWFVRFFGMKRGGAIIPHVHNNMVSSHLVVNGAFHARTFDRRTDLADPRGDAVLLLPVRDETIVPGGMVTMSDDRENAHWLVAEADRSFTFDVGVVDIAKDRQYTLAANKYNMIFVDPSGEQDGYGLVTAPVLTFDAAVAKFAA